MTIGFTQSDTLLPDYSVRDISGVLACGQVSNRLFQSLLGRRLLGLANAEDITLNRLPPVKGDVQALHHRVGKNGYEDVSKHYGFRCFRIKSFLSVLGSALWDNE